jgi:toxin YoeB
MRDVKFTIDAFKEYVAWSESNKDMLSKINDLLKDTLRDPFKGLGKPEPLKNSWKGYWSRRITDEHRLVYRVENETIVIIKCHGHYI